MEDSTESETILTSIVYTWHNIKKFPLIFENKALIMSINRLNKLL